MFCQSILPTVANTVILQSHWQYHVKLDGQRQAQQCYDTSKRAAPILHALAKIYSLCVEYPIHHYFLALAAVQTLFSLVTTLRTLLRTHLLLRY